MIGNVLQLRDLQELCRPGKRPRLATVERWAKQHKIRVQYDDQGGVWTTTAALNEALGLSSTTTASAFENESYPASLI